MTWSRIPYNLIPFDSIVGSLNHFYSMVGIRNVLGNFILLLPLALLLRLGGLKSAVLHGLFISLGIELTQLILTKTSLIHSRSFDIDDLILNSSGFTVGYWIKHLLGKVKRFIGVDSGRQ